MEQKPAPSPERRAAMWGRFSMIAGIAALFTCSSPPTQLLFGAMALIMAYMSRSISRPLGRRNIFAIIGTVLGVFGVLCSLLLAGCYVLSLRLMDDPSYAAMYRELMQQYQSMFSGTPAQ